MNRIPRFLIWIIATIVIISSFILIYLSIFNNEKEINAQALTEEIPLIVTSNEPLEFIQILEKYSNIEDILPVSQITNSKIVFETIESENTQIKSVAWVFEPATDDFAIIISANKNLPTLLSGNGSDSSGWYTDQINGFTLCASSKTALAKFNNLISGAGFIKSTEKHPKYGNRIHLKANNQLFKNSSDSGSFAFDIIEYQNTLFINGVPDNANITTIGNTRIPVSGNLSEPELFASNPLCIIQYSNDADHPVISLKLSAGNATATSFETTKTTAHITNENAFATLSAPIKRGPFVVDNHQTGTKNIVAFDIENTMYLFDAHGNLKWKKQFPDEILGDVFQVDRNNNGKYQYIWNSKGTLHMIDVNGEEVKGFPFEIPGGTRKGISLVHFKGYTYPNILYINQEGKVININLTPTVVPDWNTPSINFPVSQPISYLNKGSEHYVIVAGENGEVVMLKKNGQIRMRIKKSFVNNSLTEFYFNNTNSKGNLITTNNKGTLIYIPKTGAVASTDFGQFSEDHYFIYADFDNDKNNDFMYIDKKKIIAFNRFKREIFSHTLSYNVLIPPKVFKLNGKSLLGVINPTTSTLEIFTEEGKLDTNIPCEERFTFVPDQKCIFTAVGKSIYKNQL